jgi:hypothetical protein
VNDKTPLLAEIELIVESSLVHSPKVLRLVENLEKSSTVSAELHVAAAAAVTLGASKAPMRIKIPRIMEK